VCQPRSSSVIQTDSYRYRYSYSHSYRYRYSTLPVLQLNWSNEQ